MLADPHLRRVINPHDKFLREDQIDAIQRELLDPYMEQLELAYNDLNTAFQPALNTIAARGVFLETRAIQPGEPGYAVGQNRVRIPSPGPGEIVGLVKVNGEDRYVLLRPGDVPEYDARLAVHREAVEFPVSSVRNRIRTLSVR
ncbi:MAG: hypothetical protein V1912_05130 [bacterium]